jgi:hypothetical protein
LFEGASMFLVGPIRFYAFNTTWRNNKSNGNGASYFSNSILSATLEYCYAYNNRANVGAGFMHYTYLIPEQFKIPIITYNHCISQGNIVANNGGSVQKTKINKQKN